MLVTDTKYRLYSVPDLLGVKDDPNRWIVREMVPKAGRVLVYGAGGTYKSSILFDLCIAASSGGKFMEEYSAIDTYGPVLLLSTEGSLYTNRDRLFSFMRSRNVEPTTVQLFYGQQPLLLKDQGGRRGLKTLIEMVKPVMVVCDPMVSFYGGNENDSEQMARFINGMNEIIYETGVALVIVHHANKQAELRGSSVLQGWADAVIKFSVVREQQVEGLEGKRPVLSVKSEKQRDGTEGLLFTATPFFDKETRTIRFATTGAAATAAYLELEVLKYLRVKRRDGMTGITRNQLMEKFNAGSTKMEDVLTMLETKGAAETVDVVRRTGTGLRSGITGWRATITGSKVDQASSIMRAQFRSDNAVSGEPG